MGESSYWQHASLRKKKSGTGEEQSDGMSQSQGPHQHHQPQIGMASEAWPASEASGAGRDRRTYTRVSRACNGCRRSKMRCTGVDNPPCDRCRVTGEPCVIEKSSRGSIDKGGAEDRIVALEAQMSNMQNSLEKVIQILVSDSRSSPMSQPRGVDPRRPLPEHVSPASLVISPQVVSPYDAHRRTPGSGGYGVETSSSPAVNTIPVSIPSVHPIPPTPGYVADSESSFKAQRDLHMSLPPSRAGSEGPGDVLAIEEINNPLGEMSNMAELVEAAVQRAKEGDAGKRPRGKSPEAQVKRARFSTPSTFNEPRRESSVLFGDAVQEGLVSEIEARALVDLFFAGAVDVCPASIAQTNCFELAQRMAVDTLMRPTAIVEDIQGLLLLAAFTDAQNSWLIAGHAVRMAIDLGLHRSFNQLMKSGMGKGKSPNELELDRPLVSNTRVWFALYRLEHQMSFGMGRPAILGEDQTIEQCRSFLDHPLTIANDARLISAVELMAIRNPIHIKLSASPEQPIDRDTLAELKKANDMFDAWEIFWRNLMEEKYKFDPTRFERESVENMRQLAELFINSQLLRGVREPSDVVDMPEEKRQLALRAMRNAQRSVEICLRSKSYSVKLRHMTHYTHVCAAFVASFLIRIARLFPDELDMRKTADDVEQLANLLSQMPAGRRYAKSLHLILRRARNAGVIPIESAPQQVPTGTYVPNAPFDATLQSFIPPLPSNEIDYLLDPQSLKRAGIFLVEGDPLPLFLDDHSLGTSSGPADSAPFNGLEDFFLPAELDDLLASFQPNP